MEQGFWHKCWERNALGFHQHSVHLFLTQYFSSMCLSQDKHVFVPLCGKSSDMLYLGEYLNVTGNELSEIACRDFFQDNGVCFEKSAHRHFTKYSCENISLLQGDFFALQADDIPKVDWIYDRAALVALPEAMQNKYVAHLKSFFNSGTRLFLVTVEFPKDQLSGPPFAITSERVARLFDGFHIEHLASHDLPDKTFAQRQFDVDYLTEKLYVITLSSDLNT